MAGLSDVPVVVRPGRARRVVLVRRQRGRQWSVWSGLCNGPYGRARRCLVAVGCPLRHLFPVGRVLSWFASCGVSACEVVVLLPAFCSVGRRLRCLMASPSCCRICWAVVAV